MYLTQDQLPLDARVVEQTERAVHGRRRRRVAEAVGDQQAPVPIVFGVRTGVARHEVHRRFDVTRLVGEPQVELQVGPVVGERIDDPLEGVGQTHRHASLPGDAAGADLALGERVRSGTARLDLPRGSYPQIDGHHRHIARRVPVLTEGCGLVDRSERGKLALTGSGAAEFLNGQVTNELTDLRPGEGRYAAFLTNKGKMLGDLRILAVVARTNADGSARPNCCSTPSAWRCRRCST